MADNDMLNFDLELPPLPKRPAKLIQDPATPSAAEASVTEEKTVPQSPAKTDLDDLPPLPSRTPYPSEEPAKEETKDKDPKPFSLDEIPDRVSSDNLPNAVTPEPSDEVAKIVADDDFELPPLPQKTVDNSLDAVDPEKETTAKETELPEATEVSEPSDEVDEINTDDDFELPPLPDIPQKEEPEEKIEIYEEDKTAAAAEAAAADAQVFDFDNDYDADLDNIDANSIVLEEMTKRIAPIRSGSEESARNMKERIKMSDLANEVGQGLVLDDLSDEYTAIEDEAMNLREKDKLDQDQKRILRSQLDADLGKRPANFNARASQNMYNKLMDQKRLKIAKKGFAISLIPVILGLVSAGIAFTQLGWGTYTFIKYFAVFMVLAALLLLIKSKHTKLFAITIYALCLLLYVGPGLIMYVLDPVMSKSPDKILHLVFVIAAVACNIISVIILQKNEAVNTYYTTNFKKK